ncbi:MAG: glycosyltransferase family 39 protein [Candidatus Omnitrophica bacterium]|nr:glycosyltransferase family 39 protein [Candidatus Omnitrophota bacterium]
MFKDISTKKILFVALTFAFFLRLFWIFAYSPKEIKSDPYYYDKAAKHIIEEGSYRNGQLFAYRPPAYPYFLAGIYKLFGYNYLAVKVIQAILSILTCIVIYLLTKLLSNKLTALIAAGLFAFYPQFIRYPGELWSETLFLFLFMSAILFLYRFMRHSANKDGIISGILLGLSALTRETAFLFIAPISVWIFISSPSPGKVKKSIKKFLVIAIFMMVTMSPWIIRNYAILHKIVPVSTNGGINFYMGNNPDANGDFLWRLAPGVIWPDTLENATDEELSRLELRAGSEGYKKGIEFILEDPIRSVRLSLKKLYLLWRVPYHNMDLTQLTPETIFRIVWLVWYAGLIILAIPAIIILIKDMNVEWWLFHFWIISISLVIMLTYSTTRYRLLAIPFIIILASLTIEKIIRPLVCNKGGSK